jgi:hypothetical protein
VRDLRAGAEPARPPEKNLDVLAGEPADGPEVQPSNGEEPEGAGNVSDEMLDELDARGVVGPGVEDVFEVDQDVLGVTDPTAPPVATEPIAVASDTDALTDPLGIVGQETAAVPLQPAADAGVEAAGVATNDMATVGQDGANPPLGAPSLEDIPLVASDVPEQLDAAVENPDSDWETAAPESMEPDAPEKESPAWTE